MFNELPKLFEKNFFTAYFLPLCIFLTSNFLLLKQTDLWSSIENYLTGNVLIDTTLAFLIAWIGGILLLVLNRVIIRIYAGYDKYNPLQFFKSKIIEKYEKKLKRLEDLDVEYKSGVFSIEKQGERTGLLQDLVNNYPDKNNLLPTTIGNIFQAFEIYPNLMYGLDGNTGWLRLLSVIPKEYRELIDDAKAQFDWWVNISFLSIIYVLEFIIIAFCVWSLHSPWWYGVLNFFIPVGIFILLFWFFIICARKAALGWGDYIKSAFDVYRAELIEKMGLNPPKNRKQERELWEYFSQAIIYRMPENLPDLIIKKRNQHKKR